MYVSSRVPPTCRANCGDRLTRLLGLFNRFRLEELLEVWLTVKRALVALVIVDVKLLATLHAPEAILVPDQTLGLCLFHLEDDLAAAPAVCIRIAILTHLSSNSIIPYPHAHRGSLSRHFSFLSLVIHARTVDSRRIQRINRNERIKYRAIKCTYR